MPTNLPLKKEAVASVRDVVTAAPEVPAGFRLQRLEVLNWGTFHKNPWSIEFDGETALLTGGNGSGKSTLVDALLTLLVPNRGRNYNQAAGESNQKRERTEKSYVRGAYAHTRTAADENSRSKFLRDPGEISVLLAYFTDALAQKEVTLAQVLWLDTRGIQKFFAVADIALKIEDFSQCSDVRVLKKTLAANGVEVFERFSQYEQQFRKRFGLKSHKALDLFNQTVSIKQIESLNGFVRNHMLEKVDMRTKIDELQESYENLTISHAAIQAAREQLEILQPLAKEGAKCRKLEGEAAALENDLSALPAFFAKRKKALLIEELRSLQQDLARAEADVDTYDQLLMKQRQQANDLDYAIKQDSAGQQLRALEQEISSIELDIAKKQSAAEDYNRLAQQIGLEEYSDAETFYEQREKGLELSGEIKTALDNIVQQRDKLKIEENDLCSQREPIADELESLRSRKSQIPKRNLDIRSRLTQALNLDETDLPFAGELLQVREQDRAWEGAIERLLRGFGLCLLVPEAHYAAVNAYVNKTDLRGRLVYYKVVSEQASPTARSLDSNRVPAKLQVKEGLFFEWLRSRLAKQFNYVCAETIEQFQRETRAITASGLTKHGAERHEKDDRNRIGDRSRYILGWDNASKIKALEADLKQIEQQLTQAHKQIRELETVRSQQETQQTLLQNFMWISDFSQIDWQSAKQRQQSLIQEKKEIEEASDKLRQLEAQLKSVNAEIQKTEQKRTQTIQTVGGLSSRQQSNYAQQKQCESVIASAADGAIQAFEQAQAKLLKDYALRFESIESDESGMQKKLRSRLKKKEEKLRNAQYAIVQRMARFKAAFSEVAVNLRTEYDSLSEYVALKEKIEQDDLPRHEKGFKQLMNDKITLAITIFRTELETQEKTIEETIARLNESLMQINYSDATYIELCCAKTNNKEIRQFREDLRVCLGDVARQSAEDQEERFQRIQTLLIKRFKEEERWTKLVTDVRNWLDFSVIERYRADDVEKEHHTDSSGKSGGQKAKLAYTILASALAYQFGVTRLETEDMLGNNQSGRFRFVVIDEAFSRSDENNARYAMELFKKLGLQLLVVTPMSKIHVMEPYIGRLHFASNAENGDYSQVTTISIEEHLRRRHLAETAEIAES